LNVLDGVEGIKFCHFDDVDVVRHHLVQRIVRAYDTYSRAQQLPLPIGDTTLPDASATERKPMQTMAKPQ
jgi:phosphate starvation-inducible PhoH-like protein